MRKEILLSALFTTFMLLILALPCVALAGPVPDTGQSKCYHNSGELSLGCSLGTPFDGQDAQYGMYPQSYTKLDDDGLELPDSAGEWVMVRDNITGLIWEVKNSKDIGKDYNNPHDADNTYSWYDGVTGTPGDGTDTLDFIDALNSSQFGGFDDWRLPTIKELSFIRNMDTYDPAIDGYYFPNTWSSNYWSSNTAVYSPTTAWHVYFYNGNVGHHNKSDPNSYVRAVRGEQFSNDFRDNGDGTVTDMSTGLMWEVKTDDGGFRDKDNPYTWQEALAYAESLILNNDGGWTAGTPNGSGAKHDDWRLPNINELQSLLDFSTYDPAIDTSYFPNIKCCSWFYYWSSTTRDDVNNYAWVALSGTGQTANDVSKLTDQYVRAVRGGTALQFDIDRDGRPDGPVELILCEEQTVALDIWLTSWDSTNNSNVTEAEYYFTWDDTWLDVLGVSCYDDTHGGPWESGTCVVSANDPGPGSYRLSVSESTVGVSGPKTKLHTVTLKATDAPKSAWIKASLVSDSGPVGSVARVSGAPFDEDNIHESENDVSTVCSSDPLEGSYDELQFDYQCPATATPKPGEDYYELLNEELQADDTFCKGEMAIISHTYLGSYPATLDNAPPICDSVCFEYKVENCKYVSGQGCYIKCIHGCRNGFCVDSASKCEEYRERIKCNIISYFQCLNSPYVDLDCGFEINETIALLDDSDGNCATGDTLYDYPLSDYGTAAREIPMPLQTGSFDICAGSTLIETVTVEDCGSSACIIKITDNKFEVDQGLTSHLAVSLESDEVGEYTLSLDRFLDDAHTESMYVPSSLQVASPVTVEFDSVSFEVDAIDPGVENGEIHWANILVMAQGPSVSCEATFTLDIRNISVNEDCEWDDTFSVGRTVYGRAMLGLAPDTTYDNRLYVVDHRTDWTDEMDLTTLTRVSGSESSFTTDGYGNMGCSANEKTVLWEAAQADPLPAYFDIVIDVNGNEIFDEGTDLLDAKQTPGFEIFDDPDGDGVTADQDNCPSAYNPDQDDDYPPGGNGCGDACECEGNVHGDDSDVDGSDAFEFKQNFGRTDCSTSPPCLRDHECDGDVDGSDAFKFKTDFGRSDCPSCTFSCSY